MAALAVHVNRLAASVPNRGPRRAAKKSPPSPFGVVRASAKDDDREGSGSGSSGSEGARRLPVINTRRALLGGAVSAAASMILAPAGPANAKDGKNGVYWVEPKDGATVPRSFKVRMGVIGYEVAPAADGLQEGSGHHHIVVDGGFVEKGTEIPFDATHLHYGKAQKEATVELEPGPHTLTLQFADAKHRSFGKKFAKTISINVE